MMNEEMMKQVPHMMGNGMSMMGHPLASGAMLASAGFAAGRGVLGHLNPLRNPLLLLAGGLAAGYLLHKYEKEVIAFVTKATGLGKDFVLEQKENLADLVAEAQEAEAQGSKAGAATAQAPADPLAKA